MKRFGILAAGLCAAFVLCACDTTESQNTKTTSAGAVGAKTGCCASGEAKAGCCKAGESAATGNMGAVGEKPACTKTCPATGTTTKDPSMGAVGDKPAGCCAAKKVS